MNNNEITPYQNLWGITKAGLKRKFTGLNIYIRKKKRSQIYLNNLEWEQIKSKVSRRKEIIKNQTENQLNKKQKNNREYQ